MSQGNYKGISIREAMEMINKPTNGWYLPNIQRQYVWGARAFSEEYICLLVDSLLRGFPIGGLVLWETDSPVAYREFLSDYMPGKVAKMVPEERFSYHKYLVYDGQQRLQTLYTVLYHRFNDRTLYYNLLFDPAESELDDTGFFFKGSNDAPTPHSISMIELMGKTDENRAAKVALRNSYIQCPNLSDVQKLLIETNFDNLWEIFVGTNVQSLAYFPVRSEDPRKVNEVFRRLNTGGIQLTQLEMVLSAIKEKDPYFEESLWQLSEAIKAATGTPGYEFSAHEIVQLIYLIVLHTTRVDERKVGSEEVDKFIECLGHVQRVLPVAFKYFFYERFRINASWIVLRQQAVMPILAYFVLLEIKGCTWEPYKINLKPIVTYFVKSQLCDWNTQTMVTSFAREVENAVAKGDEFPLDAITKIAIDKNRTGEVSFGQFEQALWFSLKIVTPSHEYLFNERKPQIDHIFPMALHDDEQDKEEYRQSVNVIWNMQPTPAGLNNFKRAKHPVEFFGSDVGRGFVNAYDHLPELTSESFADEIVFIAYRKQKMLEVLKNTYAIELKDTQA